MALELINSPARVLALEVLELADNCLTIEFLKGLMRVFMDY